MAAVGADRGGGGDRGAGRHEGGPDDAGPDHAGPLDDGGRYDAGPGQAGRDDPAVRTLARLEVEDGLAAGRDFEEIADRFFATSGVSEPYAVRHWREQLRRMLAESASPSPG